MRESGYYWVLRRNIWTVGFYSAAAEQWTVLGSLRVFVDQEFSVIDERRIIRQGEEK